MYKLSFVIVLIIFLIQTSNVFGQDFSERFNKANEYYRSAEYDNAIEEYEKLINEGFLGSNLYYNLGNSYYRIGKIGYALLNYERALKYSPSDEDIKHNLAFANLSTIDRIQPLPEFFIFEVWESVLASFSLNGWTYLAFLVYILLLLLIGFYFFARSLFQQKLALISSFIVFILFLFSVSLLFVKIARISMLN